jgi:hypothetical protein
MTIEVPKNCRRLVRAYEAQGYVLVQSEHERHLLKLVVTSPVDMAETPVYITMGRSPLSLVNRDPSGVVTGVKIPRYTAEERKHAADLVFGQG